ncbi:interleukin-3-like [Peromyscus eremicus]|uniref:interleukin-3-like n=1 Tax=Peromyscus eremicus TaxID=42410 RepID=UPI0027DE1E78|nr:interleukin-3-like [Peromyscus eremicus]
MVLASSTTSVLSMLLLLPMLFHWGLQTPVRTSPLSGTASTLSCSSIAKEIMRKLNASELTDDDVRDQLRNETLQRANLCEFLQMRKQLKIEAIKTNLEYLERCLPAAVNASKMTDIFLEKNSNDFQKKLKYYVSQLKNLQLTPTPGSPHPTSDSAFCPESNSGLGTGVLQVCTAEETYNEQKLLTGSDTDLAQEDVQV